MSTLIKQHYLRRVKQHYLRLIKHTPTRTIVVVSAAMAVLFWGAAMVLIADYMIQ